MKRAAGLVCGALLLAGCAGGTGAGTTSASPSGESSPDLIQLREHYGLVDCPETDLDAAAIDGGLPKTALPCLGSEQLVNLAGLPRRPMVVNLWAQWCGPCREEAPFLREALAAHPEVQFLGIDYNDPKPDWAIEFASLAGWDYPHVADMDKTLQRDLGVPGIPMTLLVDDQGRIVARHPGVLESAEQLDELIREHW